MARIRTIKPEFWQDECLAGCSPHARLLAIAVLQLCDLKGRFKWIKMQVHAHTFPYEEDLNIDEISGELERINYLKIYKIDGKSYCWVPGFEKHQRITGKEASTESKFPEYQQDTTGETKGCFPEEHLGAQEREGEREREEERNIGASAQKKFPNDSPKKPKAKRTAFKPPSVSEVREYANERSSLIDPENFVDHYTANGWMRGKTKIKDWKACLRTWEKNTTGGSVAGRTLNPQGETVEPLAKHHQHNQQVLDEVFGNA